jgi:archaellin
VKWPFGFMIIILIACLITTGCTDEGIPPGPGDVPPPDPIKPGQVLLITGDVTGDGTLGGNLVSGTIDTITFTVKLVPGAKSVNMENASIVYADAIRTETLVPVQGYRGDPPDGAWGILDVKNEIGKTNNRLDDQEQFVIRINPRAPLVPRQLMTISVKIPTGTPLTVRRVAPATIVKENNILLPL